ncbi:MAG: glycoside hydrolase family 31 protein [Anaerolineaceae bacterium]|nr:glycoside hydrolase family 31 protein [Anaerolineaceae bacterium]
MTDQNKANPFSILHQPYGENHPYIPMTCERSPRDPASGEPITLQVETEKNAAVQSVSCLWQIDSDPLHTCSDAVKLSSDEETDIWQVELPAFIGGESVQYRFLAENANQHVESQKFSFHVTRWINILDVVGQEENVDQISVILRTEHDDLLIRLVVQETQNESLRVQLSKVSEKIRPADDGKLDQVSAQWGNLHLSIFNNPLRFVLHRTSDGLILQSTSALQVLIDAQGNVIKYRLCFDSPEDEGFYGFGERFNALDQRGQHLDNRVYGQYTSQGKRTYMPIPFYLSSRGYGMWLKTDRQAEFDLAAESPDRWYVIGEATGEHAQLEMIFLMQASPKEIVQTFTKLTGMPKLPPDWVFGLWMSSNDWNSQKEVLHQLQLADEYDIPATVLVIEAWSDEINFYIWNDAQYEMKPSSEVLALADFTFPHEGRWPDPKAMVDELHQAGIRLVLWQNPAIKQAREDEHLDQELNQQDQIYVIEKGFVVRNEDENPHRVESHMPWFGDSLVLDFTNPGAEDWWFSKRAYLVQEMGVDGFKTDGGEHIWDLNTVFHNGMRGHRSINRYPVDYEEAYRKFMEKYRGDDFVLFSRAGYTGAQVNPCHWAGDENSTWEAFRATINAMLNVGISGVPFFGWDIAGFAGPIPTSELYLRATAFSVFCPIMQYHSDVNHQRKPSRDRTPWNMQEQSGDEDVIPVFRWFTNVRMNLMPYILNEAYKSSQSGLPMTRALALEFPKDKQCRAYPWQYLFGDALLVSPVVEENAQTWKVYLPAGEWRDFWTGEMIQGPITKEVEAPRDFIPVYQRKSSMVALQTDATGSLGSPVGNRTDAFTNLTLRIFPGGIINESIKLPEINESVNIEVNQNADGSTIEIMLPALTIGVDLILYTKEPGCVMIDDKALLRINNDQSFGLQAAWYWHAELEEVIIHFPETCNMKTIKIQ